MAQRKITTITVGNGGTATFDATACEVSPFLYNATLSVEAGCGNFSVEVRHGGVWFAITELTAVAETTLAVVNRGGWDAVRLTVTNAGGVTCSLWQEG